jgi:hypothetical protein
MLVFSVNGQKIDLKIGVILDFNSAFELSIFGEAKKKDNANSIFS